MQLHIISYEEIIVAKNRQRREFAPEKLTELAASIADNGLIHPLVVRRDEEGELVLVAGERRLRALEYVWNFGQEVRCGERIIPEKYVPCLYLGEIDPVDAFEIELEENVRRTDLAWQDKITAEAQLLELRRLQANKAGLPAPTTHDLAMELNGVEPETGMGVNRSAVRMDILLAKNLSDPDIARARSRDEAEKIFRRKEEQKLNEELGIRVGATFSASDHTLLQGDCLEIMKTLPTESFDVILTDPPYGISADEFGDSGGKTPGAHGYDDSYEHWQKLMQSFCHLSWLVTKPQAHLYMFCDVDNFIELRTILGAEWEVFRTPLIWVNPTAMRAPWIESGPQRKWQMILYAKKGDRRVTQLFPDVITCASDTNLGHMAQKPVGLYSDLLRRSIRPGDSVLDPFAGTGPIFPAAHYLKCRATGVELDPGAIGIASWRLGELK